jgi:hypothetical protein
MARQQAESNDRRNRAARGREETPDRRDPMVERYERLLAAIERIAASRERTGLSARLGREQLHRSARA